MADSTAFSILIPLLALIVIELSKVARDIDLVEVAREERLPMKVVTYGGILDPRMGRPSLGRFNVLHFANTLILTFGIYLAHYFFDGDMKWLLAVPLWIVLALLPILEVDEYGDILKVENPITSFRSHLALTLLYVSVFLITGLYWVFAVSYIGATWVYLRQLSSELPIAEEEETQAQLGEFATE